MTLTFTLPRDSVEKREILKPISINVYRNFEPVPPANSPAAVAPANPTLLLTIPPAMVDRYMVQGRFDSSIRFAPRIFPAGAARLSTSSARLSRPKSFPQIPMSPRSRFILPANPIADLKAEFQRAGVTLSWTPPEKTLIGTAPNIAFYRVYRAEIESAPAPARIRPRRQHGTPIQRFLLRASQSLCLPPYIDTQAELGKSYVYSVRSVAQYPGVQIESLDSNFATITPKDVFPPPAPQDLVVAFVPAARRSARLSRSFLVH